MGICTMIYPLMGVAIREVTHKMVQLPDIEMLLQLPNRYLMTVMVMEIEETHKFNQITMDPKQSMAALVQISTAI